MDVDELAAREHIRELIARYNLAGDRGRIDELVDCFADDAVLEIEGEPPARGREAIAARMRAAGDALAARAGRRLLRHHVTTSLVELASRDLASARSYFLVVTEIGVDHSGRYVDRFRREEGRWRIAHRRVAVDWFAPDSRFPAPPAK
jgi:ketosteroid isomerase-like protein